MRRGGHPRLTAGCAAGAITPGADPVKRRGMLDVMQQYFVDKNNAAARTKAPTLYCSHRTMFRVERRWQLHVWELTGAPATWRHNGGSIWPPNRCSR
jgi:hypothetical protein